MGIKMPFLGIAKMKWNQEFRISDAVQRGSLACNHNATAPCAATLSALLETEAICHGPLAGAKGFIG